MRSTPPALVAGLAALLLHPLASPPAYAQGTVIYRCESADGVSLQSRPCPKGAKQSKRTIARPSEPIQPAPASEATPAAAVALGTHAPAAPVTAATDIHGPNDPYPLWQCMRADGSTFESRDGVPGKQWVVNPASADSATPAPLQITTPMKEPIVTHIESATVVDTQAVDPTPPPPGAAAGVWVPDQCTRLEPSQACERFAARRDQLRRQIYASMPSERVKYAPEEQDLTSMLFAACGR